MSVEEFYQQRYSGREEGGGERGGGGGEEGEMRGEDEKEEEEEGKMEDEDSEEALKKARDWDEFKDGECPSIYGMLITVKVHPLSPPSSSQTTEEAGVTNGTWASTVVSTHTINFCNFSPSSTFSTSS